jgi:hypothetical protein
MTDGQRNSRLDGLVHHEIAIHFGGVTERLERMDATPARVGKQVIAGLTGWTTRADADYSRLLASWPN